MTGLTIVNKTSIQGGSSSGSGLPQSWNETWSSVSVKFVPSWRRRRQVCREPNPIRPVIWRGDVLLRADENFPLSLVCLCFGESGTILACNLLESINGVENLLQIHFNSFRVVRVVELGFQQQLCNNRCWTTVAQTLVQPLFCPYSVKQSNLLKSITLSTRNISQ